jgi:hypothetical protein
MGSADAARDLNNIVSKLPPGKILHIHNYGYTTVMGTIYAALFPNGFDRMTNDGTFDAAKVVKDGGNDPVAIKDAEKALQAFFDSCAAAQPCTIADPGAFFNPDACTGCYFWAPTAAGVKVRQH